MKKNTPRNETPVSNLDINERTGDVDHHAPHLVRMSSLHPNYVRQKLSVVPTPVRLMVEDDLGSMTENWTHEEIEDERRLVRFNFTRVTHSDYLVKFEAVRKDDFTHDQPIISCIFWKEKNMHIATSVDIILILEYLVQLSFTIEEKNRIRRNLQSLKPYTISRANKSCQRFFNVLMNMEDPRPRNIEKDLKVFKWGDLFNAFNKVISKYSTNTKKTVPNLSGKFPRENSDVLSLASGGVSKNRGSNDYETSFLPNERLKVLKRKVNQSRNLNQLNINGMNKLFQHALTPADPIRIKNERTKLLLDNLDGSNKDAENIGHSVESKDDLKVKDAIVPENFDVKFRPPAPITTGMVSECPTSASISGSESNSRFGSISSVPPSSTNSMTQSSDSQSDYSNTFNQGSTSTQISLDAIDTNMANEKKLYPTTKDIPKVQNSLGISNYHINNYREQQYPFQTQLYYNTDTDYKPLSENNVRIFDERIKEHDVHLPPINTGANRHVGLRDGGIELPPLKLQNGQKFTGPLPGPSVIQSNIEEYRKQSPNNITPVESNNSMMMNFKPINGPYRSAGP